MNKTQDKNVYGNPVESDYNIIKIGNRTIVPRAIEIGKVNRRKAYRMTASTMRRTE